MENVFDYIKKYGDLTFKEKGFNDVDNLIFTYLSYLNYANTNLIEKELTLNEMSLEYLENNRFKDVAKLGFAQKQAYKMIEVLKDKIRYKDIILSNYVYDITDRMQFSALTFKISKKLKYICFEGTDEFLSGWMEDLELACFFPVPSQEKAIEYVNKSVKLFGSKVIIGGHSKGGNLALVSAMFMKWYKKFKVKKVYNNDGPGLRKKEFESKKYKKLKKKYMHIVPEYSMIGVLLRHDDYTVVKSMTKSILAHSIENWMIKDDKLILGELSSKSKKIEASLISWLDMHDDEDRIKIVNTLFKIIDDSKIKTLPEIKKINNIISIVKSVKNIDKQSKDLIVDLLTYNYKNTR